MLPERDSVCPWNTMSKFFVSEQKPEQQQWHCGFANCRKKTMGYPLWAEMGSSKRQGSKAILPPAPGTSLYKKKGRVPERVSISLPVVSDWFHLLEGGSTIGGGEAVQVNLSTLLGPRVHQSHWCLTLSSSSGGLVIGFLEAENFSSWKGAPWRKARSREGRKAAIKKITGRPMERPAQSRHKKAPASTIHSWSPLPPRAYSPKKDTSTWVNEEEPHLYPSHPAEQRTGGCPRKGVKQGYSCWEAKYVKNQVWLTAVWLPYRTVDFSKRELISKFSFYIP